MLVSQIDTPYFIPFNKTVKPARGCVTPLNAGQNTQVHVLLLDQADEHVYLHINGSDDQHLALVLSTPDREVVWHLTTTGFISPPDILISDGSYVVGSEGSNKPLPARPAALTSLAQTTKIATAQFSHITSVTKIQAANGILINLPLTTYTQPSLDCNSVTTSLDIDKFTSSAVTAYYRQKQQTYGCYHQEAAGLQSNDVHVIDLRNSQGHFNSRLRRSPHVEDVVVELVPAVVQGTSQPLPRNLTLVLKSDRPVRWLLKSRGIQGKLVVTTHGDNPVENLSVSSGQQLDIQKNEISDQFDRLMKEVTQQYGFPLSYMKVHHANLLEMSIPPRSKRELSNVWERNRPGYNRDEEQKSIAVPESTSIEDQLDSAAQKIMEEMTKTCDEKKKDVSISIPDSIVRTLGVDSLTLNDVSCQAQLSDGHWNVVSHSTACGSTALTYADKPMYRNNIIARFNTGTLKGQQTKIPFICKFKPGIPGISLVHHYEDDSYDDDYNYDDDDKDEFREEEEIYGLTVRADMRLLLKQKSDSATVNVGDTILVSSSINAVPYLALAMEQCWLSNTSSKTSHATNRDLKLIVAGCPAHDMVSLFWDYSSSHSSFSFKVTQELAQSSSAVWLQCRMGLCSATEKGAVGNMLRCVDPREECSDPNSGPHKETSIQTVTIRGPLILNQGQRSSRTGTRPRPTPETSGKTDEAQPDPSYDQTQTRRTLVEVPVEVAVAISIASFIVGALSTGSLWFLHSRALRLKATRLTAEGSVETSELQSMLGNSSVRQTTLPVASNGHCVNGTIPTSGDQNGNVSCPTCPLVVRA